MGNTVHYTDEVTAREHGVILELTPSDLSYLPGRAKAICAKTGKVIRNDNEIWVRHQLEVHGIRIVELSRKCNSYDKGRAY